LRFKNTKTRFHGFSHEHHLVGPEEVSIFEEVRNSVPAIKRQLQTTDSCALLAMHLKWTMPIHDWDLAMPHF
jgi:hypothetical protein